MSISDTPQEDPSPTGSDAWTEKNTDLAGANWREPWIDALIRDSNQIPSVLLLCGYVGEAPNKDSVRLFLDACFLHCVDIPREAILHREGIPKTMSPLGGSYIWIDRKAWPNLKMYRRQH